MAKTFTGFCLDEYNDSCKTDCPAADKCLDKCQELEEFERRDTVSIQPMPQVDRPMVGRLVPRMSGEIRQFETGATRDTDKGKFDYEGFLSPLVIERFAAYMHKNRVQSDGSLRDSDNWQKGIPQDAYIKSLYRHFMDMWKEHRGIKTKDGLESAICGIMFNAMGYLHETLTRAGEGCCDEEHEEILS